MDTVRNMGKRQLAKAIKPIKYFQQHIEAQSDFTHCTRTCTMMHMAVVHKIYASPSKGHPHDYDTPNRQDLAA